MKLKNSTAWPDYFLRRMVSWCAKQLEMPARQIRSANFRNSRASWGGAAYWWSGRITVCIGEAKHFPANGFKHGNGMQESYSDREECLIEVTAHEMAHCLQKNTRTRRGGSGGGSEVATDWHSFKVLKAFREQRDQLIAQWSAQPVRENVIVISFTERRAVKAQTDLERWQKNGRSRKTKCASFGSVSVITKRKRRNRIDAGISLNQN